MQITITLVIILEILLLLCKKTKNKKTTYNGKAVTDTSYQVMYAYEESAGPFCEKIKLILLMCDEVQCSCIPN